jgi:hypothetical protein
MFARLPAWIFLSNLFIFLHGLRTEALAWQAGPAVVARVVADLPLGQPEEGGRRGGSSVIVRGKKETPGD